MPLLEKLDLSDGSVIDVSPLFHCKKLKRLHLRNNQGIEDLSPLCRCPNLEELDISALPLIKDLSFFEKGFTKLRVLKFRCLPVDDLSPLTRLKNLQMLACHSVPQTTSLLPLARCYKLKVIVCSKNAMDLAELRERRPDLEISW